MMAMLDPWVPVPLQIAIGVISLSVGFASIFQAATADLIDPEHRPPVWQRGLLALGGAGLVIMAPWLVAPW